MGWVGEIEGCAIWLWGGGPVFGECDEVEESVKGIEDRIRRVC